MAQADRECSIAHRLDTVTLLHIPFPCRKVVVCTWSLFKRTRVGSRMSQKQSCICHSLSLSLWTSYIRQLFLTGRDWRSKKFIQTLRPEICLFDINHKTREKTRTRRESEREDIQRLWIFLNVSVFFFLLLFLFALLQLYQQCCLCRLYFTCFRMVLQSVKVRDVRPVANPDKSISHTQKIILDAYDRIRKLFVKILHPRADFTSKYFGDDKYRSLNFGKWRRGTCDRSFLMQKYAWFTDIHIIRFLFNVVWRFACFNFKYCCL